jgi:hypothetical protein
MDNLGRAFMHHSQLIESVDNLEAKHTPTPLADLAIVKDDDLDYGSRREGLVMQLNHGYISHSFKDNYGRVAILTARANLSDYIVFPHTYSLHRTVRTLVMVRKFISVFREKWDPGYMATFKPILPTQPAALLMLPTTFPRMTT